MLQERGLKVSAHPLVPAARNAAARSSSQRPVARTGRAGTSSSMTELTSGDRAEVRMLT